MMCNPGSRYELDDKSWFDPRLNARVLLIFIAMGSRTLKIEPGGGYGVHTKFLTISRLYLQDLYMDFTQLSVYYDGTPELSRINMMTYVISPVNYALAPTRNTKREAAVDLLMDGNRLSITWFREDMSSGFRSSSQLAAYTYKKYPEASELPAPPFDLADLTPVSNNNNTAARPKAGWNTTAGPRWPQLRRNSRSIPKWVSFP